MRQFFFPRSRCLIKALAFVNLRPWNAPIMLLSCIFQLPTIYLIVEAISPGNSTKSVLLYVQLPKTRKSKMCRNSLYLAVITFVTLSEFEEQVLDKAYICVLYSITIVLLENIELRSQNYFWCE